MRIGMILDAVFPPDPRVENEAMSLLEKGHQVYLFSLHYGTQKEHEEYHGIKVCRYLSNQLEYKLSALVYTVPFYSKSMSKKIAHFLLDKKIEAVHVHDIQVAEAVFKANQKYQLPIVLDLHENRPEIMKFYGHLQKFPGKYLINPLKWKQKEEAFVAKASKIIVVTNEAKEDLIKRSNVDEQNVVVVPNTVRKSFYENTHIESSIIKKYERHFVLLYIGDTALRRGLETAIEAIVKLKVSIANIKLVIVGTSKTDVVLKQKVKELNIEEYVDFEGWQNVSLFPSYIKASTVCISPLHRNLHHDTTYANKIFQYMSLAKPLLVSNATAQKNIVSKVEAGLVHKDRDTQDFTLKVLDLFNNKKLLASMGKNGEKFVKNKFLWEQTSKGLTTLYDNL